MARFSVVVPVYNAQRYIEGCLDSLMAQGFEDFEVVCVDDGSTDGSPDLLAAYARRDGRVRVVRQDNAGPSAARNAGIRESQGDFIVFLDADDELVPWALGCMARHLESDNRDALVFGWTFFGGEADRYVQAHADVRDVDYPVFREALVLDEMTNPYLRIAVRREALLESGVRFDELLRVGEDAQFLMALYPRICGVRLISDKLYCYRLPRPGSIMADYVRDDASQCLCDIEMAISLFADWRRGNIILQHGGTLLRWFIRACLYNALRQPVPYRRDFVRLVKQLLEAAFADGQIEECVSRPDCRRILEAVLASDAEGNLPMSENALSFLLLDWRIREYGLTDFLLSAKAKLLR